MAIESDLLSQISTDRLWETNEQIAQWVRHSGTEEERAAFKERAKQVEEAFIERSGERGAAILEQMKKDLAAARQ